VTTIHDAFVNALLADAAYVDGLDGLVEIDLVNQLTGRMTSDLAEYIGANGLDQQTAERFAQTVNKLKGVATVIFVAHQLPKGLAVDEVSSLGAERTLQMRVVEGEELN
jgi:hypothetical protein